MNREHTPTPYILKGISQNGKKHFNIIASKLGAKYKVCRVPFENDLDRVEAENDAKFIVKACNNHDRLVEALKETSAILHLLTRVSIPDHFMDEAFNITAEAKQLLAELKTQS